MNREKYHKGPSVSSKGQTSFVKDELDSKPVEQNSGHKIKISVKTISKKDVEDQNTPLSKAGGNNQLRRVYVNCSSDSEDILDEIPSKETHTYHSRMSSVVNKIPTKCSAVSEKSSHFKKSLKRSASFVSSDSSSPETTPKISTEREKFMNERRSDTALMKSDTKSMPLRIVEYTPSGRMETTQSRKDFSMRNSYPLSTPKARYPERPFSRSHHRSDSYRKSAADQTPFSPAESSSRGRIKRMRTSYLPFYDYNALNTLNPGVGVIDSHCHLDFLFTRSNFNDSYASFRATHSSTFPQCYEGCIAVFCEPQNFSRKAEWDCILQEKGVWGAFGCHPHMAKDFDDTAERALRKALKDQKVIALGEIGLDYSSRNGCDKYRQHEVLRRQILIALEEQLPLVIHCREAHDDCMEIMQDLVPKDYHIHLHCFTDKWTKASKWLDAFPNLYIGITNVVTFPSAEDVHETARNIPLERLLLETDTPYFVPRNLPRPMRWSHPGMVIHVAAQIAALKETVTVEELLKAVRKNTHAMYGI